MKLFDFLRNVAKENFNYTIHYDSSLKLTLINIDTYFEKWEVRFKKDTIQNFDVFYNDLEKNNFNIKSIKAFYYFDVGRWDIMLKNNKIIKLPENNYIDLLPEINLMLNDTNFSKYKVFDFRLKNQLILK